jgi:ribonuclease J
LQTGEQSETYHSSRTHEIGGTLIELRSANTRLLIDAGYPLFLNGLPIEDNVTKLQAEKLLELGVLPPIEGLYQWDVPSFDAVVISHAHIDHYGLLKYVHPDIPVYMSVGTKRLIDISQIFKLCDSYPINDNVFKMYEPFEIGDFSIKPYLMDHSAFDAAAFEISAEGKTVIYSGDFRGHGRKSVCLDTFIKHATKQADILLTEGTMLGRLEEKTLTEKELEELVVSEIRGINDPVLFQSSSQNIDRVFLILCRKYLSKRISPKYIRSIINQLLSFVKRNHTFQLPGQFRIHHFTLQQQLKQLCHIFGLLVQC